MIIQITNPSTITVESLDEFLQQKLSGQRVNIEGNRFDVGDESLLVYPTVIFQGTKNGDKLLVHQSITC